MNKLTHTVELSSIEQQREKVWIKLVISPIEEEEGLKIEKMQR